LAPPMSRRRVPPPLTGTWTRQADWKGVGGSLSIAAVVCAQPFAPFAALSEFGGAPMWSNKDSGGPWHHM
jgi:hypothetical protein